jgi:hypothetical protein
MKLDIIKTTKLVLAERWVELEGKENAILQNFPPQEWRVQLFLPT